MVKTLPSNVGVVSSIPSQRPNIPHTSWPEIQSIKQKQYCNKFNKNFKNGPHFKKSKKKNTMCGPCGDLHLNKSTEKDNLDPVMGI